MSEPKEKISDYPFTGNLMAGLIYPSVLGSALVWLIQFVGEYFAGKDASAEVVIKLFGNIQFLYGLWFCFYFSLSWLLMVTKNKYTRRYDWLAFSFDFAEAIIIFLVFLWLGMVNKDFSNLRSLYVGFFAIPTLALFSNLYLLKTPFREGVGLVSIMAWILSVLMFFWLYKLKIGHWIGFVGFSGLIIFYIIKYIPQETKEER